MHQMQFLQQNYASNAEETEYKVKLKKGKK